MMRDCYVVLRATLSRRRSAGGGITLTMGYAPAFVTEDYGAACRFRDALTEETGSRAQISRAKIWEAGNGEG